MTKFPENLSLYRKIVGLSQKELAEKVNVTPAQVSRYERGLAEPRPRILEKISSTLDVPVEILIGNTLGFDINPLPVIGWDLINDFLNKKISEFSEFAIADPSLSLSSNSFGLRINGDSMSSSGKVSFPDGSITVFEPTGQYSHNDFVLAQIKNDYFILKQLAYDAGRVYLLSLNKNYAPILADSNELKIVAKAMQVIINI